MKDIPESIRAVLMSPQGRVLLMKIQSSRGTIWITPGGRREPGETAHETLRRELSEETGSNLISDSQEVWVRHGTFFKGGERLQERERFFYVPCEEFVPMTTSMEDAELSRFRGYRWWPVSEVKDSPARLVTAKLGTLLEDLQANGPSTDVIETGE
jgi:8-oxo-dGTP pyrophosphatase MutT (NUDIX family)